MPPKLYIENSFLSTDKGIIETLALRYERRLESDLRRDPDNPRVAILFDLCHVLWRALSLKEKGKLSKSQDKKLMSSYTNKLSKL